MKTIKINTYLPVFPGFYGTHFEADESNEIDYINEERESKGMQPITYDECIFDYAEYRLNVSKECTGVIEQEIKSIISGKFEIIFENISSPREYNFSNDSINIEMIYNAKFLKNLTAYLRENMDAFTLHLKENYTSRDGFMSFHETNPGEWIGDLQTSDSGLLSHKLGSMLEFVLENEGFESSYLYDAIETKSISATNYNELIGE